MADRPRFRYVNESAGAFVLITFLIVGFLVFRAAWINRLLRPGVSLNVIMPEAGSFGLKGGSEVIVLGTRAGEVIDVGIRSHDRMHAELEVRGDFARFIRTDSKVTILKKYGIAGDTYLQISRGVGEPLPEENAVLYAQVDPNTSQRLDAVLEDLQDKLLPLIDQTRIAVEKWSGVADYLRAPERDFGPILANLESITGSVVNGEGLAGRLLSDKQLADEIQQIVSRLNHAAARIDPIMEQIEQVSEDSSVVSGKLRSEAEQLPGLIQRLQDTSAELRTFVSSLREAGHELPPATKSIRDAAERIPSLVLQAQEAVRDIETLAEALRQRFAPGARTALPPGRKVAPGDAAP